MPTSSMLNLSMHSTRPVGGGRCARHPTYRVSKLQAYIGEGSEGITNVTLRNTVSHEDPVAVICSKHVRPKVDKADHIMHQIGAIVGYHSSKASLLCEICRPKVVESSSSMVCDLQSLYCFRASIDPGYIRGTPGDNAALVCVLSGDIYGQPNWLRDLFFFL